MLGLGLVPLELLPQRAHVRLPLAVVAHGLVRVRIRARVRVRVRVSG